MVQEDQTQLVMYSVVPEVYSLEPTSKPPTPPAKPVLKENETALSELFMRPVLSKVDLLISSVASTENVLDLAMEVIPEHLTLPVMAMEATSEQRANPVLALETLSKHSCLPAKATPLIILHLGLSLVNWCDKTLTPPGVDVLEGGKLTSNNVAGSLHDPLQSPAVASGAVSKPGGDAAGRDALHSAVVEGSEDTGAHSKLPQPSQEEEALMCLLQHCICVSRPCEILSDVNAEELKAVYLLHRCPVDGDGCVFSALSPEIHHQLLGLVYVE